MRWFKDHVSESDCSLNIPNITGCLFVPSFVCSFQRVETQPQITKLRSYLVMHMIKNGVFNDSALSIEDLTDVVNSNKCWIF